LAREVGLPQERIRRSEDEMMGGPIIKGIEKEVNMGPILDPTIHQWNPIPIISRQNAKTILVKDEDQTVTRELLHERWGAVLVDSACKWNMCLIGLKTIKYMYIYIYSLIFSYLLDYFPQTSRLSTDKKDLDPYLRLMKPWKVIGLDEL
jgi:hypothetical protein